QSSAGSGLLSHQRWICHADVTYFGGSQNRAGRHRTGVRQDRRRADRSGSDALLQLICLQPIEKRSAGRRAAAFSSRWPDFGPAGVVMPPVTSITIVYDPACGLCTRVKEWIGRQVPLVGIQFVASGSSEARRKFAQLPAGELAVVAGTGEVWLGNRAWIVCLWALREYRDLAVRLTSPLLQLM